MTFAVILALILVGFSVYAFKGFFEFKQDKMNVPLLLVGALGFYYGIGTLTGLLLAETQVRRELLLDFALSYDDLGWPLLLVGGYAGVVWGISRFMISRPLQRSQIIAAIEHLLSSRSSLGLFLIIFSVQLYGVVSGKIGLGGLQTDEQVQYRISPLVQLVTPLSITVILVASYAVLNARSALVFKILCAVIIITQLAYVGLSGRRMTAIAMFVAYLGFYLADIGRARLRLAAIILGSAFIATFGLFYALRLAGYSEELKGVTKFERIAGQVVRLDQVVKNDHAEMSWGESLLYNVSTRSFFIGYYASLVKADGAGGRGQVLKASFLTAVPSVLWRNKDDALYAGSEEWIAFQYFTLPRLTDEANTLITSGHTDLPYLGPIFFIVIVIAIMGLGIALCHRVNSAEAQLAVLTVLIVLCLNLEDSFAAWFVGLRNLLIYVGIFKLWSTWVRYSGRSDYE